MKKRVFILIGRSGCGKGTQASLLQKHLRSKHEPFYYLESGAKFRKFITKPQYSSVLSKRIYDTGALQPEFLAVYTWSHLLVEHLNDNESLILDGTPRKLREAHVLETALDFYEYEKVYVIHLSISREESKARMCARGRMDDIDPEDVEKRLNWFDTDVYPTIEWYRNNPRYVFIEVDGMQPIETVLNTIIDSLHHD